jgi:hypothetical protein
MTPMEESLSDEALLPLCVERSNAAWAVLVNRHPGCVRQTIRRQLGAGADPQRIEDIEQNVWVACCANDYRWLRICLARHCRLDASLRALSRYQVLRWRKEQRRQHQRARPASLDGVVDPDAGPYPVGLLLEELAIRLTPQERRYLVYQCRRLDPGEPCPFSDVYGRKLRHQLRRKYQFVFSDQR